MNLAIPLVEQCFNHSFVSDCLTAAFMGVVVGLLCLLPALSIPQLVYMQIIIKLAIYLFTAICFLISNLIFSFGCVLLLGSLVFIKILGLNWDFKELQRYLTAEFSSVILANLVEAIIIFDVNLRRLCSESSFFAVSALCFDIGYAVTTVFSTLAKNKIEQKRYQNAFLKLSTKQMIKYKQYMMCNTLIPPITITQPHIWQVPSRSIHNFLGLRQCIKYGLMYSDIQSFIEVGQKWYSMVICKKNEIRIAPLSENETEKLINSVQLQNVATTSVKSVHSLSFFSKKEQEIPYAIEDRILLLQFGQHLASRGNQILTCQVHNKQERTEVISCLLQQKFGLHCMGIDIQYLNQTNINSQGQIKQFLSNLSHELLSPTISINDNNSSFHSYPVSDKDRDINQNAYIIISETSRVSMNPDIPPSHAYLIGWVLAKSIIYSIPIASPLSNVFLGLASNVDLTLNDVNDFDSEFSNQLKAAELDSMAFHELISQIGNVQHQLIKIQGSELRYRAINVNDACSKKYYLKNPEIIKCLQQGFRNAIFLPFHFYLDMQLLKACCGSMDINVKQWQQFTIYENFNKQYLELFFEVLSLPENQLLRRYVLTYTTGLYCPPSGGFESLKPNFQLRIGEPNQYIDSNISDNLLVIPPIGFKFTHSKAENERNHKNAISKLNKLLQQACII